MTVEAKVAAHSPNFMAIPAAAPFRVASLLWQSSAGVWMLTVVCKATFRLEPDVARVAEAQDEPPAGSMSTGMATLPAVCIPRAISCPSRRPSTSCWPGTRSRPAASRRGR